MTTNNTQPKTIILQRSQLPDLRFQGRELALEKDHLSLFKDVKVYQSQKGMLFIQVPAVGNISEKTHVYFIRQFLENSAATHIKEFAAKFLSELAFYAMFKCDLESNHDQAEAFITLVRNKLLDVEELHPAAIAKSLKAGQWQDSTLRFDSFEDAFCDNDQGAFEISASVTLYNNFKQMAILVTAQCKRIDANISQSQFKITDVSKRMTVSGFNAVTEGNSEPLSDDDLIDALLASDLEDTVLEPIKDIEHWFLHQLEHNINNEFLDDDDEDFFYITATDDMSAKFSGKKLGTVDVSDLNRFVGDAALLKSDVYKTTKGYFIVHDTVKDGDNILKQINIFDSENELFDIIGFDEAGKRIYQVCNIDAFLEL